MNGKAKRWFGSGFIVAALLIGIILVVAGCTRGAVPVGWSGVAIVDGNLFIGSTESRVVEIPLDNENSPSWTAALTTPTSSGLFGCSGGSSNVAIYGTPVVTGGLVYIAGYNGRIYAYVAPTSDVPWDPSGEQPRWVYPTENFLEPFVGGIVASDGKLFVGNTDGKVYALDAATGRKLWEFATGDKIWGTPAVSDGVLYIGSFDKKLYAIDTSDGSNLWEFSAEGTIVATPTIYQDTIFIGSFDRNLYALDRATGNLRWQFTGGNWFWAEPVVIDGTIYAPNLDGKVYAIRADTGALVKEFDIGPVASKPAVAGGTVVLVTRQGVVFKLDTATGGTSQLADLETDVNGPITVSDNIVYIHAPGLSLQRINIADGSVLPTLSLQKPGEGN